MNRLEVFEAIGLVTSTWSNWKLPDRDDEATVVVDAWLRLLSPLEAEWVVAAIDSFAVEGGPFAPHQGMIAKRAIELRDRGEGRRLPDVDEAWAEVQAEIARVGWVGAIDPNRKPRFSHPAIADAVAAMNWQTLCESKDQMVDRAHFLKLYGITRGRVEREAVMPPSVRELLNKAVGAIGRLDLKEEIGLIGKFPLAEPSNVVELRPVED